MDIREFYRLMREGHIAKTSAVASAIFKDTFEAILAEGKDILYLAFSSGLSATCNNGRVAAEDAVAKFPDCPRAEPAYSASRAQGVACRALRPIRSPARVWLCPAG